MFTPSLHVHPADFGLASVDEQCLTAIAVCKFCVAPVKIIHETWTSQQLPIFKTSDRSTSDFGDLCEYLKHSSVPLAYRKESDKADAFAYWCLVKKQLIPAANYSRWVDPVNYSQITHKWHAQQFLFPFNLMQCNRRKSEVETLFRIQYRDAKNEQIEKQVIHAGIACLNMLNSKLGDSKYFYGDKPSIFDAQIFGVLAVLLKVPQINDRLQRHLKFACANLTRFVEAICSIYMPLDEAENRRVRARMETWMNTVEIAQKQIAQEKERERQQMKRSTEEHSEEYGVWDKVLFGTAAVLLSLLAAVHFGVVQVELSGSDDDSKDVVINV